MHIHCRTLQHRVIVDQEFSKRAELKDEKDPEKWKTLPDDSVVTGKIFCANKDCRFVCSP